tara:strand:+ start:618 stop:812 length:195 start_codon:yes stop_codon:yes gene_type:complete
MLIRIERLIERDAPPSDLARVAIRRRLSSSVVCYYRYARQTHDTPSRSRANRERGPTAVVLNRV